MIKQWCIPLILVAGLSACSDDSESGPGADELPDAAVGSGTESTDTDSGSSADASGEVMTGRFLDSAVQGLGFSTNSGNGTTNANGEFSYLAGELVTFSIGDLALPTVLAKPLMTAFDLFATNDQFDLSVLNLNRLLQSLDIDMNSDNGITIGTAAASSATGLNLDFGSREFEDQAINLIANSGSGNSSLIDIPTASTHFFNTLDANNISSGCTSDHPAVGTTAPFQQFSHEVAGQLTVIDDCTLEIRGFAYDGQGPDVFFFAATGTDYASAESFIIGPRLNRSLWQNDSLRLALPDGKTLDDFDNLSVWCLDFQIDFGSVALGS